MNIVHFLQSTISLPPTNYGGTERVIWSLAKAQQRKGHNVRFLWSKADRLPENSQIFDASFALEEQLGNWPDIIHFHSPLNEEINFPHLFTIHSNSNHSEVFPKNSVFVSKQHALNHGSSLFVHNGLEWDDYGPPKLKNPADYCHYLAKAGWYVKNFKGAMKIAKKAKRKLHVLGGKRCHLHRRVRYCSLSRKIQFHGMVGGEEKNQLIRNSSGLLFPVRWHEPFGLASIESLYLGTPVFATAYGALPEIITSDEVGLLSNSYSELANGIKHAGDFNRKSCHELARDVFNADQMAEKYHVFYERILNGKILHAENPISINGLKELLPIAP